MEGLPRIQQEAGLTFDLLSAASMTEVSVNYSPLPVTVGLLEWFLPRAYEEKRACNSLRAKTVCGRWNLLGKYSNVYLILCKVQVADSYK